jgi:hypothetical protein
MSQSRMIFRPGPGAVVQAFTAGFVDSVLGYPADWYSLSTVAPATQGSSGTLGGGTLGAADYVEVTLLDTDNAGAEGLALGVSMGPGIGSVSNWDDVNAHVAADGDLIVIQCWGVHPQGRQVTGATLGDHLAGATVAGEPTNSATPAAHDVGVALDAGGTYGMATAGGSDEDGTIVFITCMG